MKTALGHLGYCTNIHVGEHWSDHFAALRTAIPALKQRLSPDAPFGLGLRLSNLASEELMLDARLQEFKAWLTETGCYVFTMNGFPFGGFHHVRVKDQVHAPDWTTEARVAYTIRLFRLLTELAPEGLNAGISTSPLSYRHWFEWDQAVARDYVFSQTTQNLLDVVAELVRLKRETGRSMHLDIEPEPDGLLETADEFIDWFTGYLLPMGTAKLAETFDLTETEAADALREHVQLCYDVCHFAVGYEQPTDVLHKLKQHGLRVGKIQISAALKAEFPATDETREEIRRAFMQFNEPTYLHQVVARNQDGRLVRFPDLPEALKGYDPGHAEWRSHFHVPIFIADYGVLHSTQDDIVEVLRLQQKEPFTDHLEVETYTWTVLPDALKRDLTESIGRELEWTKTILMSERANE